MNDLHEQLASALDEIMPRPAPVDAAMRRGARLRWRRRAMTGAGLAAVVAAAVTVPHAVHLGAKPPAPATGGYTVTVLPPLPHGPAGQVLSGTVNGMHWSATVRSCQSGACFFLHADGRLSDLDGEYDLFLRPDAASPVLFEETTDAGYHAMFGMVSADVSYVETRFGNGTVVTLRPAVLGRLRVVAFAAPLRVPMHWTAYDTAGRVLGSGS